MNKKICLFLAILLIPSVFALNLDINKIDKGSVIITELNNPAKFTFEITNHDAADNFQIYSLVGVSMSPKGSFELPLGKSEIEVTAYATESMLERDGFYNFEYQIKGQNTGIFEDFLTIKIVPLEDALSFKVDYVSPGDSEANVVIKNMQNANLEDVTVNFDSVFFEGEKKVSLKPFENVTTKFPINKDKIKTLKAGPYVVTMNIEIAGKDVRTEGIINYLEKEGISVNKYSDGFIIRKVIVNKTNEGNVVTTARIEMSRDIISRLVTVFSSDPLEVDRNLLSVDYVWENDIEPGESFIVTSTTNYTFPFIAIILIVLIVLFAKMYSQSVVNVQKRVSFVRTKTGNFALKVTVHVKSRGHVDNVQLIDHIPGIMKLYEKYGRMPDKIDSRRLMWNLGSLNSGEERVVSYIIYTNVNVVGRFELPAAMAVFEKEGRTNETLSNRTFFVSETMKRIED